MMIHQRQQFRMTNLFATKPRVVSNQPILSIRVLDLNSCLVFICGCRSPMWRASSVSNESTDSAESTILDCRRISLLDTPQCSKCSRTGVPLGQFSSRRVVRWLVWPTYRASHPEQVVEYATSFRMNTGTGFFN